MPKKQSHRATILACIIGNTLEWYDFSLFAFFATIIAQLYFPAEDKVAALLSSFGIFAIGYLMRPLGGILLGHIGDKVSRKRALVITILSMGFATMLMGVLPTYYHWGIWAPLLLTLLRIVQGLGVGGEYPGSMVILVETAKPGKEVTTGTFAFFGAVCGMLLASLLSYLLTHWFSKDAFNQYGWRIAFILGFALALIGVYVRLKLWKYQEHLDYKENKAPFLLLWQKHAHAFAKAFALFILTGVYTGVVMIFLVAYLTHYFHLPLPQVLLAETLITIIIVIFYMGLAVIIEKFIDPMRWMRIGCIVLFVCAFPLYYAMQFHAPLFFMTLIAILGASVQSPLVKVVTSWFPKQVRYTGTGLAMGLAMSIFAGTAPLVGIFLIQHFGLSAPAFYLMFAAVCAYWGATKK